MGHLMGHLMQIQRQRQRQRTEAYQGVIGVPHLKLLCEMERAHEGDVLGELLEMKITRRTSAKGCRRTMSFPGDWIGFPRLKSGASIFSCLKHLAESGTLSW